MRIQEVEKRTPFKQHIDMEKACRGLVQGKTQQQAYKDAGYIQEGRQDNSRQLSTRYFKKPDVVNMIQGMKDNILFECQGMTLKAFNDYLRNDLQDLPAKDKGAFLIKAIEKTGLDAPKRVEVDDKTGNSVDIKALAEMIVSLGDVNGELANANTKLIEGTAETVCAETAGDTSEE